MNPGPVVPGQAGIPARGGSQRARAGAAERLGGPAARLRVGLDDAQGSLAVEVTGPIREQSDIVAAATAASEGIKQRVGALSGRRVGRTHIELTGIVRAHEGRVR